MISGYEYAPHRWRALRDQEPLGMKVRGCLSPRMLAQELVAEPWQVFLACALLNRTRRAQAHTALWRVLARWPTLEALSVADRNVLASVVHSCGFGLRRSDAIKRMSVDIIEGVERPFGTGWYAMQSKMVFVDGVDIANPTDHELEAFVEWSASKKRLG